MTIRVLIADDQPLIRVAYKTIIDSAPDMEVVAEAGTGREAVDRVREQQPDVALLDIRMPDLDGLAATERITAAPDLADVRILIITTFDLDEYVYRAVRAGASGFLGKGIEPDELLDAIRVVHSGDALLSCRQTPRRRSSTGSSLPRQRPTPPRRSTASRRASRRSSASSPPACPTARSPRGWSSASTPRRPT